jgi:serine/threonine protein kinase
MTKRMGKYELGRLLGTGNFSKVRLGTDTTNGEVYAIKIVDKHQLAKERLEDQLKREIAVLKILRHTHVAAMKEVLQTTRHIYIVLELVSGGDLFDSIVQHQRFEEPKARKYFQQIILGVKYCHMQGIAHRDLKPENIMLDGQDVIKIADFGLANLTTTTGDLMQTVCGTPNYVAPEVIRDRGYDGFVADVWSCGIILYVMMSGHQAFDDSNVKALFNKIERGEYRMSRHFTEGAKDLISKILIVDPTKRLTLNQIIQHPWFQEDFDPALLAGQTVIDVSSTQVTQSLQTIDEPTSPTEQAVTAGEDAIQLSHRLMSAALTPMSRGVTSTASHRALMFRGGGDKTTADVQAALKTIAPNVTPAKSESGSVEFRTFITTSKGLITLLIEVTPTSSPGLTLIEVKKGRGDVLDFQELCKKFVTILGPENLASQVVE